MSQSNGLGTGDGTPRVYRATLTPNREDRPRYAKLVVYRRYHDDQAQVDWVQPTVLQGEWNRHGVRTRSGVKEVAWKSIKKGRPDREFEAAWKKHVAQATSVGAQAALEATARRAQEAGL